jgi:orotate phosphoribosyltransferase
MMTNPDAQFWELLAARQGHFKLESGHHGDLWLDLDQLLGQPARLQP